MKKLLFALLVLGLAVSANAGLTDTSNTVTDGIISWSVVNGKIVGHGDSLGTYDGEIDPAVTDAGGTLDSASAAGIAGYYRNVGASAYSGFTIYAADDTATDTLPNQTIGDWFTIDYTRTAGTMYVEIWNSSNGYANPVGTLTIIPEPITVALLGLGGLFLRRRK